MKHISIVGGGLAGCETAWYLANKNYNVTLYEMRPHNSSGAHVTSHLAELVCSNSLKSLHLDTAAGLLKSELKHYNSLLLAIAEKCKVPAGSALAVDRDLFGKLATDAINDHPNITVIREEIVDIPTAGGKYGSHIVLACGPLMANTLASKLLKHTQGSLSFVDAISPVISADSIDYSKGFFAGRYGKGGDDYLNLPMTKEQFQQFYVALLGANTVQNHDFEDEKVFERCIPIEFSAKRGEQTLLFGPMKPVGLEDPITGEQYHAVVQLRFENKAKTAYNIVGFQTKMTYSAQKEVLSLIPGLEKAEFLRYGTIHRNSYIDAPKWLNPDMSIKGLGNIYMAGQITGVEGYLESMASGIITATQIDANIRAQINIHNDVSTKLTNTNNTDTDTCDINATDSGTIETSTIDKNIIGSGAGNLSTGGNVVKFDENTAFGALQLHLKGEFGGGKTYSPSNFHFGMLPPLDKRIRKKADRKVAYSKRACDILGIEWI